jgi:hypothetical protein
MRFLRAVLPGFLGSEDAPTIATLLGLKNMLSIELLCMNDPPSVADFD